VIGNPARQVGWACLCGRTLDDALSCPACRRTYSSDDGELTEYPEPLPQ